VKNTVVLSIFLALAVLLTGCSPRTTASPVEVEDEAGVDAEVAIDDEAAAYEQAVAMGETPDDDEFAGYYDGNISMWDNFARIPAGTFTMGSPASEPDRDEDETQRRVTVNGFEMSQYEVTVGEFRRFVETVDYVTTVEIDNRGQVWTDAWEGPGDATWENPYITQNEYHPVVLVSWLDAIEYCNWLSIHEGLTPAYARDGEDVAWDRSANGYRLPTEAEWEYACRAGTTGAFNPGSAAGDANYGLTYPGTTEVGSFPPNDWGLYDMHGNVWEWCWDWYADDPANAIRIARGGSWCDAARDMRSANRDGFLPFSGAVNHLGFRVARGS
jgi:formylglycine-generating enzyme required for sulfatase activity